MTTIKRLLSGLWIAALAGSGITASLQAQSVHTWAENSALAQGTWVKVALNQTQDGIYQISYSDLRKWGFSDPSKVGVYGFGGHVLSADFSNNHIDDLPEVATLHDKSKNRILFYGRGLIAWQYDPSKGFVQRQHPYASPHYGTYAYYFLHEKENGTTKSIEKRDSAPREAAADTVTTYDEYWLHELNETNLGSAGQEWYGESFLYSTTQSFVLPEENSLSGHIIKAGTARLSVGFVAKASASTSITVHLNSQQLGKKTIGSTNDFGSEVLFDAQKVNETDMQDAVVRITYNADNGSPSSAHLNFIRLQGQCDLEASSKEAYMLFRHAQANNKQLAYRISGLTDQMQLWDVTSPTDIQQQECLSQGFFVASGKGLREYAIVNTASNAFPSVTRVGTVKLNQNLHGCQTPEMVIIAPSGLFQLADSLGKYRLWRGQLESVITTTPEAIYNEYSSGVPDATAIRLFLKNMYDKSGKSECKLRYALFFGDGSYNNYEACTSSYLLPSYENTLSLSETSSYVTDDYFGFLDDNEGRSLSSDRLDIGIGRLPVSSLEQGKRILEKLIRYEENKYGSWRNRLCFLADDEKIENGENKDPVNEHVRHCDTIISQLQADGHNEFMYQKIYLPAYQQTSSTSGTDYPDARKDLNNALQQGILLLDYAGHGASNNIAHEQLMTINLAKNLNMAHLPLWIMASCNVSRWDADDTSLAEALINNPNGGAIGVIGATREVYMTQNRTLNRNLMKSLCLRRDDGSPFTLGDMIRKAKTDMGTDANKLCYGLMGDPSLTLNLTRQRVVVDSIKGDLKTLSTIAVYGHVNLPESDRMDSTFSGLLFSNIFDAADSLSCDKGLWNGETVFRYTARNRKLFSGRSAIDSGRFKFSFMIPQDISYNPGNGLMNFYAWSTWGKEANGYYEDFTVEHDPEADTQADIYGPRILSLFLDNPDFKDGDKVSTTPFFYAEMVDESGINATGNSIGHDISLTLKCLSDPIVSSRQYVLNSQFSTMTGTSLVGNIKYSLDDLPEGTYQATFRVWDVYNNVTVRDFTFTTSRNSKPTLLCLQAYPSPVSHGGTVTFSALHNRPESADQMRLQIYTQTGIKVLDQTITSSACPVVYLRQDTKEGTTIEEFKKSKDISQISNYMNADETSQLMGQTTFTWQANVAPGIYIYRVYLTAGGEESVSESRKLIVQ